MRLSRFPVPTVKETPNDAVVVSHKLMLRAGMIRQVARGIYVYLPLALRTLRKIEQIVREEMDRAGAAELLMPAVQPSELWLQSGRWTQYGPELLRFKDRSGSDFCMGPTHEEVITWLASNELRSYRQLPVTFYQIQTKFRDEVRPRFGLMRGREFIMKDAYSFDSDVAGALKSYDAMYDAYRRIFARCGLRFRAVEADTGSIGGSRSHEFHVLAQSGEDAIASDTGSDYAANVELAPIGASEVAKAREAALKAGETIARTGELAALTKVHTPGARTIDEVAAFLGVAKNTKLKTLVFLVDEKPVVGIVRGDRELNEIKLRKALGGEAIALADEKTVERVTGAPVGFAGPVGLADKRVPVVIDPMALALDNAVCGANEADHHLIGVNVQRDFSPTMVADITSAEAGDMAPSGKPYEVFRGIEVGHVFYLGTKYSQPMGANVLDADGKAQPIEMGCYGIGVSRTMAAAIEQNHDENGIVWPMAIAPFQVVLCPVNAKGSTAASEAAQTLHDALEAAGVEVLLDDRDERPGVMFKDADLMGVPLRVTLGKALAEGKVEFKQRSGGEAELVALDELVARVKAAIAAAL